MTNRDSVTEHCNNELTGYEGCGDRSATNPNQMIFQEKRVNTWPIRTNVLRYVINGFSPLSLIIGIVLGNGWHSVAEHHIGVVKCLLHLHGTVWTPADVVICWTQGRRSICVNMRTWPCAAIWPSNTWKGIQILDILRTHTLQPFTVPTWLQWVLNIEHGGPVAIHQVLLNLIFGNVAPSIFYSDACFQVVEVAAVQLKEFNEQNTDVDVGTAHILPVV